MRSSRTTRQRISRLASAQPTQCQFTNNAMFIICSTTASHNRFDASLVRYSGGLAAVSFTSHCYSGGVPQVVAQPRGCVASGLAVSRLDRSSSPPNIVLGKTLPRNIRCMRLAHSALAQKGFQNSPFCTCIGGRKWYSILKSPTQWVNQSPLAIV